MLIIVKTTPRMIFLGYKYSSNEWSDVLVPCWYLLKVWILIAEPSGDGSTIVTTELVNISMNPASMNMFNNRIYKCGVSFINLAGICNLFNYRMSMIR